jgi:hypothetical protein
MDKLKAEDLKVFAEMMNANKVKRNGYIMMPSINGFDLFEISEERLKLYLQAENMHRKANALKTSNESDVCDDYPEKKVPKNMGYGKGGEMVYI